MFSQHLHCMTCLVLRCCCWHVSACQMVQSSTPWCYLGVTRSQVVQPCRHWKNTFFCLLECPMEVLLLQEFSIFQTGQIFWFWARGVFFRRWSLEKIDTFENGSKQASCILVAKCLSSKLGNQIANISIILLYFLLFLRWCFHFVLLINNIFSRSHFNIIFSYFFFFVHFIIIDGKWKNWSFNFIFIDWE